MVNQSYRRIASAAPLVFAVAGIVGCGLDLDAELVSPEQEQPPSADMPQQVSEETVTIRFRNLTDDEAVDVQFYASNNPLDALPDDLLVEENLVTTSVGIAGTGIIQPWQEDIIEYPCAANLTLGTAGGSFVDNETGEPRGVGTERWVQEGPLALCGSVVTFEFAGKGVDFTTTLTICP